MHLIQKNKTKKNHLWKKINYNNSTYNLIKNSKLVLCRDSAAVALAVLFKKPIIFITNSSIKNKRYMGRIIEYSNFFKQKPLNISKLSNEKFEKKYFILIMMPIENIQIIF